MMADDLISKRSLPFFFRACEKALIDAYSRFSTLGSTTVPSGSRTTKNICRIGPLVVSEKRPAE
jgi:hypothetical protein